MTFSVYPSTDYTKLTNLDSRLLSENSRGNFTIIGKLRFPHVKLLYIHVAASQYKLRLLGGDIVSRQARSYTYRMIVTLNQINQYNIMKI